MASQIDRNQDENVKKTEYEVQRDQKELSQQIAYQQTATQNANIGATTAYAATAADIQRSGDPNSSNLILSLAGSFVVDPLKQIGAAYNPMKSFDYTTYHPGFIPNIGGAIMHDTDAISQVQNSMAMLPNRIGQGAFALGGVAALNAFGGQFSQIASSAVSAFARARGIASPIAKVLGGAAGWSAWGLPLSIVAAEGDVISDIGGFSQMARYLGRKYVGTLTSQSINGIGFSPKEYVGMGEQLYGLTAESGNGITGYGGEHFNKENVEAAIKTADTSGLLRDATTVNDMLGKIKTLLQSYKSVANELHLTADAGMSLSASLMQMGYDNPASMVGIVHTAKNVAEATGQSYREALYAGTNMSQQFLQGGMTQTAGMYYGMNSDLMQSYLYQTHQAQYMPQGLGGYNAALQLTQQGQLSLAGKQSFLNALTVASSSGGYNPELMDKAIGMNPLATSLYAKSLMAGSPTKVYATMWNAMNNESSALSDPTMQARYWKGILRNARINIENPDAAKMYIMMQLQREGLTNRGQAMYQADNIYAQIKNIGSMEGLENQQLLENNTNMNVNIFRSLIPDAIANEWNGAFGTVHSGMTSFANGVSDLGASLATNVGNVLGPHRNTIAIAPTATGGRYVYGAALRGLGMENHRYLGHYNSGMLGFIRNARAGLTNPAPRTSDYISRLDRISNSPIISQVYETLGKMEYNPEYEAAKARNEADIYGGVLKTGGEALAMVGLLGTGPQGVIPAAAVAKKGLGEAFNPIWQKMHGRYEGDVYSEEFMHEYNLFSRAAGLSPGSAESIRLFNETFGENTINAKNLTASYNYYKAPVLEAYKKDLGQLKASYKGIEKDWGDVEKSVKSSLVQNMKLENRGLANIVNKHLKPDEISVLQGLIRAYNRNKSHPDAREHYKKQALEYLKNKVGATNAHSVWTYFTSHYKDFDSVLYAASYDPYTQTHYRYNELKDKYYKAAETHAVYAMGIKGVENKLSKELGVEYGSAGTVVGEAHDLIEAGKGQSLLEFGAKRKINAAFNAIGDKHLIEEWKEYISGGISKNEFLNDYEQAAGYKLNKATVAKTDEGGGNGNGELYGSLRGLLTQIGDMTTQVKILNDNLKDTNLRHGSRQ